MATASKAQIRPRPAELEHKCHLAPPFERPNYYYGQLLGEREFRGEQTYFREKLKLHNRCLHGWGVVCGLDVTPGEAPPDCPPGGDDYREIEERIRKLQQELQNSTDPETNKKLRAEIEELKRKLDDLCPPAADDKRAPSIIVHCGLALDCAGNELVVRNPRKAVVWDFLSEDDRDRAEKGAIDLFVRLCYCETPSELARPMLPGRCGPAVGCRHGWIVEEVGVRISSEPPGEDECPECCGPCSDPCVVIAILKGYRHDAPLTASQIWTTIRRELGVYPPTSITGLNWVHGATYTVSEAATLLGTNDPDAKTGLVIEFSKPIRTESIQPGVVDVWVIEGGGGRRFGFYAVGGEYVMPDPPPEFTTRIVYRNITGETLQDGDRVLVQVRTTFLLDECCMPVDGDHVGGRVPLLEEFRKEPYQKPSLFKSCLMPNGRRGPWKSGNGTPGGSFESWFFVSGETKQTSVRVGRKS